MRHPAIRIPAAAFAGALLLALLVSSCGSAPAEEQDSRAPVLQGRVVDQDGLPLAGVEVTIHGGFATRWRTGSKRWWSISALALAPLLGRASRWNHKRADPRAG